MIRKYGVEQSSTSGKVALASSGVGGAVLPNGRFLCKISRLTEYTVACKIASDFWATKQKIGDIFMTVFTGTIHLKGQNGKTVKRYIDLGDFSEGTPAADYSAADSAINQIAGALAAVTDATISLVTLTGVVSESAAAGAGDVFENAMMNLFLDPAGEKKTQWYAPAPSIGIFLATDGKNRDVVDTADADVIQLVQQLSQHAFVSDGEQVDTTINNGIESGIRVVRKMKLG